MASVTVKTGPGGPGLGSFYPLALALSGGGHRASLFGLGVLMALRDAGRQPQQISSVSGGSITNAVLAHNYFARERKHEDGETNERLWEHVTQRLFETIVSKGVLTKTSVRLLLALVSIPPVAFVVMALFRMLPAWQVTVPLIVVWATVVLLRGLFIEWLIAKRYFGGILKPVQLSTLKCSAIEHVFCCTDLISGRPLYVSTRDGGQIFRRFADRPTGVSPRTTTSENLAHSIRKLGVLYSAPGMSIAAAVRASAGFPGIPPRRIQLSRFARDSNDQAAGTRLCPVAYLSDGGIWNNLATQPFEDGFLWGINGPWVVVVADASAALDRESPFGFLIPGLAEIRALIRQAVIQNFNTVGPRRAGYHDSLRRELQSHRSARFSQERLYPLVSCMETPGEVALRLVSAAAQSSSDDFLNEWERKWRGERREQTRRRAEDLGMAVEGAEPVTDEVHVDPHAAESFHRLSDLATVNTSTTKAGVRDPVASYSTTLGKVDRVTAMATVGRGYANTAITLYLTGLADQLVYPKGWLGS